jgi:hypothetical protein
MKHVYFVSYIGVGGGNNVRVAITDDMTFSMCPVIVDKPITDFETIQQIAKQIQEGEKFANPATIISFQLLRTEES